MAAHVVVVSCSTSGVQRHNHKGVESCGEFGAPSELQYFPPFVVARTFSVGVPQGYLYFPVGKPEVNSTFRNIISKPSKDKK